MRPWLRNDHQRVAVVDPKTRISFLFARCRPTQPRYGVYPSVGLNYTPASRAGTAVCRTSAAALGNLLSKKLIIIN